MRRMFPVIFVTLLEISCVGNWGTRYNSHAMYESVVSESGHPIDTRVNIIPTTKGYQLHIRLTSNMERPIQLYHHTLPWSMCHGIELAIIETGYGGNVLESLEPLVDPGGLVVSLSPGETLTGEVNLSALYPSLKAALRQTDVVVFWNYQPQLVDGTCLERQGGWLLLPKARGLW